MTLSPAAELHRQQRVRLLSERPELRALEHPLPWTALAVPLLLAVHVWCAFWASRLGWAWVIVFAFAIGQQVLHAAGALIHESAHRLIFRERYPKLVLDLGIELIVTSFGKQLRYHHEHLGSHHPYQGDYFRDYEFEDEARYTARRTFARRHPRWQRCLTALELALHALPLGFLFADAALMPLYRGGTRLPIRDSQRHLPGARPAAKLRVMFALVSGASIGLLFLFFGEKAVAYQLCSLSFFLGKWGISNLGQSLSEHPGDDPLRPTRSSYGLHNYWLFNTGYHHEHHVFPKVAWWNLPKLKAAAPQLFSCAANGSYPALWWRHVCADFSHSRRPEPRQLIDSRVAAAGGPIG